MKHWQILSFKILNLELLDMEIWISFNSLATQLLLYLIDCIFMDQAGSGGEFL